MFAALAVSHWIEHQTGWSIKKFVRTARRYRAVTIQAGRQTLTAAEPLPDDIAEALARIRGGGAHKFDKSRAGRGSASPCVSGLPLARLSLSSIRVARLTAILGRGGWPHRLKTSIGSWGRFHPCQNNRATAQPAGPLSGPHSCSDHTDLTHNNRAGR